MPTVPPADDRPQLPPFGGDRYMLKQLRARLAVAPLTRDDWDAALAVARLEVDALRRAGVL